LGKFLIRLRFGSVGEKVTEVGWYVLGEDQQQVGPYAFSELRGEFFQY